jgi:hypothetical protein
MYHTLDRFDIYAFEVKGHYLASSKEPSRKIMRIIIMSFKTFRIHYEISLSKASINDIDTFVFDIDV